MVYKKYIKRGGKSYGPYKYHSRKINGKVITEYLGKADEKSKKNKTLIFLIIGFILLFSFFVLNYKSMTGFAIFGSKNENLAFIRFAVEITKTVHLDSNKNFISDIYNEIKALDDIWSETINNNEYVRVTFEQELDSSKDITIYPRIISGKPRIEIYEKNKNEIIAEFTNIISNEYNKVLLTNLQGNQDIFDLRIVDGSLVINYIVDPSASSSMEVEK
ncbi:hypothetical protein ES703_74802 [subsurface metagenome]